MSTELQASKEHFVQGVSRISHFWGLPKAMGAIYAEIYLSPVPLTLDDLVARVGVSKGAASTHVRRLERLQMISKRLKVGDRKDYYQAESDLWRIVRGILQEREKTDFNRALRAVGESLEMVRLARVDRGEAELKAFYAERVVAMKRFFDLLDGIVVSLLALDQLGAEAMQQMLARSGKP